MISIEQTVHNDKILHKLELPFGNFYLCDHVIVAEANPETIYGLDEATMVFKKAGEFYKSIYSIKKRVYISNRIHKYSVKPVTWISFTPAEKYLLGYCVVDSSPNGISNALLESKFVRIPFHAATSLDEAMQWSQALI